MAAFLHNDVYDNGLSEISAGATALHILSQQPTTYAEVATYTLGNKATPSVAVPSNKSGGGREVVVAAITNGSVTATGTATHYAIVDATGSRLLATHTLAASQAVTNGNTFTLGSFAIGIPSPA